MHTPVGWRLTWNRSTGLRFCRCIVTLNAYTTVSCIQAGSVWVHRAQCTEVVIEVLAVTFGRCDRLRRDGGKCYIWDYEQGNDHELTQKISRNLPWGTEKNHRTLTSILCSTTVRLEHLCSRTVWFMSAALFLCVWYRMVLGRMKRPVWMTELL